MSETPSEPTQAPVEQQPTPAPEAQQVVAPTPQIPSQGGDPIQQYPGNDERPQDKESPLWPVVTDQSVAQPESGPQQAAPVQESPAAPVEQPQAQSAPAETAQQQEVPQVEAPSVDFSGHALGKKAPSNKPALMLADVLTGTVPATPATADHFAAVPDWELGGNDKFGTCGPTSVANNRRLISLGLTGTMDAPALADVFDLYKRSGNPGFNPDLPAGDPNQDDNGVDMQTMLEALVAGGIGGRKPLAFAKIAAGDADTLDKAIAIFGAANLGLSLTVAQQTQSVWSHVDGSSSWGGHAVLAGRYTDNHSGSDVDGVITWAYALDADRSFITAQEDEAWVIIWPEHLGSQEFLAGVDVNALASAYQDLTGRPFPGLPTPSPTPDPGPAPAPTPDPGPAPTPVPPAPTPTPDPGPAPAPTPAPTPSPEPDILAILNKFVDSVEAAAADIRSWIEGQSSPSDADDSASPEQSQQ